MVPSEGFEPPTSSFMMELDVLLFRPELDPFLYKRSTVELTRHILTRHILGLCFRKSFVWIAVSASIWSGR